MKLQGKLLRKVYDKDGNQVGEYEFTNHIRNSCNYDIANKLWYCIPGFSSLNNEETYIMALCGSGQVTNGENWNYSGSGLWVYSFGTHTISFQFTNYTGGVNNYTEEQMESLFENGGYSDNYYLSWTNMNETATCEASFSDNISSNVISAIKISVSSYHNSGATNKSYIEYVDKYGNNQTHVLNGGDDVVSASDSQRFIKITKIMFYREHYNAYIDLRFFIYTQARWNTIKLGYSAVEGEYNFQYANAESSYGQVSNDVFPLDDDSKPSNGLFWYNHDTDFNGSTRGMFNQDSDGQDCLEYRYIIRNHGDVDMVLNRLGLHAYGYRGFATDQYSDGQGYTMITKLAHDPVTIPPNGMAVDFYKIKVLMTDSLVVYWGIMSPHLYPIYDVDGITIIGYRGSKYYSGENTKVIIYDKYGITTLTVTIKNTRTGTVTILAEQQQMGTGNNEIEFIVPEAQVDDIYEVKAVRELYEGDGKKEETGGFQIIEKPIELPADQILKYSSAIQSNQDPDLIHDFTDNANDATPNGGTDLTYELGGTVQVPVFDSRYATFTSLDSMTVYSIAACIRFNTVSTLQSRHIIIGLTSDINLCFYYTGSTWNIQVDSSDDSKLIGSSLPTGFFSIYAIKTSTSLTVILNGATLSDGVSIAHAGSAGYINGDSSQNYQTNFDLGDLYVYNRSLSTDEINAHEAYWNDVYGI